ncbi:condensation domain-containing protein [uncultured Kriegella sp.]|uniref:condensation domain-containing protein n=1 Tax=uncultured Kriegella sp. TaxID=1798910 RepID=UPI0030D9D0BC|tara:strand:+ start:117318 stop:119297 length:1980 start_codon:yes stop_codon:yes gene_type:complete
MKNELKNRINGLSHEERKLLLFKLKGVVTNQSDNTSSENPKRLVAYIRPNEQFDMKKLKAHLKEGLPEYMIPSAIHLIDEIPTLPNGKVDRSGLLALSRETPSETGLKKPKSEIEKQLVQIWEEVLNFNPISIEDNFFEIGGDSILSIQIISKARKVGILLQPNQLFENQTIAELSLFAANNVSEPMTNEKVEGEVPLTPIQHWFFENHLIAPHFWNQIIKVSNIDSIPFDSIKLTINALISHHDALCLSFVQTDNKWVARTLRKNENNSCHHIDISSERKIEEQKRLINEALITAQENCRLDNGELFRAYYFECGDTQPNSIFLIAHHLIVDMVSWSIIFNDFSSALQLLKDGQEINFNQKTASIKVWSEYLVALSNSDEFQKEIEYWKQQHFESHTLPQDFDVDKEVFEERSFAIHQSFLNEGDTDLLINEANEAYNSEVEDLLITALIKTICQWGDLSNFCLGLERLGRTADTISVDVSDTVGWFTSFFPIRLNYESGGNDGELIKTTKERLRTVPNGGIGYGLLRYLSNNKSFKAFLNQEPEVIFNYLGNKKENHNKSYEQYELLWDGTRHALSERSHKLEINMSIIKNVLNIRWSYCTEIHKEDTVILLAKRFDENLKAILQHCTTKETMDYTPSDFPEAGLSQEDLDNLLDNL